ncbi:hypothetical protein BH09GEM1_BH09GEM1_45230 [soil metagenome]
MASDVAVGAALALFHELYPSREIGPNTLDAWAVVLAVLTDDELGSAALKVAQEPGRKFFPTPGEVMGYRSTAILDSGKVLGRISALGQYNPHGWLYPSVERVREVLGDIVADAYAAAGAERCFADDGSVTQHIARRTFAGELAATQRLAPSTPFLGAPAALHALGSGDSE